MRKLSIAFSLTVLAMVAVAQPKWPTITSTSKPWTRWWWMGSAVNPKDLTANLEAYKAAGLGGVEITPIYGVAGTEKQFINYLTPQWMRVLDHTLAEGKRLGLGVDMATGTGWPFGGGPNITEGDACRDFNVKTWTLKRGERLSDPVTFIQEPMVRAVGNQAPDISKLVEPIYNNKNLQALALDQVQFRKQLPLQVLMAYNGNGQSIDLTSNVGVDGNLNWTAPDGTWTLYALFMGWHGKMVERAAPGGEGNVIDHFSLAPLKKYLGTFDKAFAGHTLSGLRGFFNDSYEVDDARGESNWTPALLDEFKKRRGYDLRQHLPALLQKERDEYSLRVLHDFRLTLSDLLLEKFTRAWQQWAKAKGKIVRNQSHGSPANILDLYGAVDIPETEGEEILRFKFAASASHVLGKPLVAAEAATWLGEHFKTALRDVKASVDKYFIGGVNHIVYHGTSYSPVDDPWPGWLFYASVHFQPANPFWRDFGKLNEYVASMQSFLQSGKPDNNVLLYFPFSDKISSPGGRELLHHFDGMNGFDSTDFKLVAEELLHKGVAFDLVSDRQIQQLANNGKLIKAPGGSYTTILLPNVKYMPVETLEKLNALAKGGATIIAYKSLPMDVPGYGDYEKRKQRFNAASLRNIPIGDNLMELVKKANVPVETMTEKGLQCVRRHIATGKYYFIVNMSKDAINDWVEISTKAAGAYLFDPVNRRAGLAKLKTEDGKTSILLQLQPGESRIVETSNTPITGKWFEYIERTGDPQMITGEWSITYHSGGPVKWEGMHLDTLRTWTELPIEGIKNFSGTATYSMSFRNANPAFKPDAYILDLGKVEQSAVVAFNGEWRATLIGPSYNLLIPANRLNTINQLTILVSNGMTNRIIDLEKQGAPYKKFYNVNFPARLAANRGSNGLFTAINWPLEASGLIGPVTLTPVTFMK